MRKSGESVPLVVYVASNQLPVFGDSNSRFPTLEAKKDHQQKKKKQEAQGKLPCNVWYVFGVIFY